MILFLDTNIWLHFKSPENWDKSLFGENPIIVVPKITIRELDKNKNSHRTAKIKKRASDALKLIASAHEISGVKLKNGIQVFRYRDLPEMDWAKHQLDEKSNDDYLIAVILTFKNANKGAEVLFYSDDVNANLTAKEMRIAVGEFPEIYRDNEKSEEQIENDKLRKELQVYQSSSPKLEIGFLHDGEIVAVPEFNINERGIGALTEETLTGIVASKKADLLQEIALYNSFGNPGLDSSHLVAGVNNYLPLYRQFLIDYNDYETRKALTIPIQIQVYNCGTKPAEDVDIEITVPFFDVNSRMDEEPEYPKEPETRMFTPSSFDQHWDRPSLARLPAENYDASRMSILRKPKSATIKEELGVIKQQQVAITEVFYVTFPSLVQVKSFQSSYKITAGNIPLPVKGEIDIKIGLISEELGQSEE